MLSTSCIGNSGEAQPPCDAFVLEGNGQETGASPDTGTQERAETQQNESLQVTSEQPVLQCKAKPETEVSGTGEKMVLLIDDIVAVEEVLGLVIEETAEVAPRVDVSGSVENYQRKYEKEEEENGMQQKSHEEEGVLQYGKEGEQGEQEQKSRRRGKSRRRRRGRRRSRSKSSVGGGGTGEDGGAKIEGGRVGGGAGAVGGIRGGGGGSRGSSAMGGSSGGGGIGVEGVGVLVGRIGIGEQEEEELEQQQKGQEEEDKEKNEQEQKEQENEKQKRNEQEARWMEQLQELKAKQEKKVQLESGLLAGLTPLEALEALQIELQPVNKQASQERSRLKIRIYQRRQYYLEQRSALIQGIPGFWAKSLLNHPQMSAMISKQDVNMLRYMTDLKVEEHRFPRDCRKILLFFGKNSYFRNEVIAKEYVHTLAGYRASHSSLIQWYTNYQREAYRRRHDNSSLNFFNWFSDHRFVGSCRIAEIIIEDVWPNPLQYFKRKKVPGEGTARETGSCPILRRK